MIIENKGLKHKMTGFFSKIDGLEKTLTISSAFVVIFNTWEDILSLRYLYK